MPGPTAVKSNAQTPNVVGTSASDDEGIFAGSHVASQSREAPNFSRPLPLSPPGSLRSIGLPKTTVVDTAQVIKSGTSSPRPLPSVPGHVYPSHSLENIQGGRGSGLGTRIIDDRDSDDIVIASPPLLPSQSPNRNHEEDGQTSTAGASDSELLYASAPSTPLRVSNDLEEEEAERGGVMVNLSGYGRSERPERRATVALGESHRDGGQESTTPKRAATVDYYGQGGQQPRVPVPDSEMHRSTLHQPDDYIEEDLEYADDLDPYLKRIVERFGDEPLFPEPLVRGHLAGAPDFPQPQQPTASDIPVPESSGSSHIQHGKTAEITSPSMPSVISFPTPAQKPADITWKSYSSSAFHAEQTSGGRSISSDASQFPLPVIAGTNLQFEPLPPLQRTASGVSRSTHGEGSIHPDTPTWHLAPASNRDRPGAPPGELQSPSFWAQQENSTHLEAGTVQDDIDGLPTPPTGVNSVAPLRILKHPRTPPRSPGIPPGAALPTPPGPSSPSSPQRRKQSSDTTVPVPEASVPLSPTSTSQAQKSTSSSSNTAIAAPQGANFIPTNSSTGVAKQASQPLHVVNRTPTSFIRNGAKLNVGPSIDAPGPISSPPGPIQSALKKDMEQDLHAQEPSSVGSEKPRPIDATKEKKTSLKPQENGSTGPKDLTSEARSQSHPDEDRSQARPSQHQSQSDPQSQWAQSTQSQPRSQQTSPLRQSHPPPSSPVQPQRQQTHSDADATPTGSPTRKRHSHGDSLSSHQPRTLAEEKAQYNAVPPASRSRYMNMLLALDDIPMIYNLLASFFTWILLAGFVLFPGTFSTLQTFNIGNGLGAEVVHRIVNLPLFVVAFVCTGVGFFGMGYLWWRWMKNYIWLVNKIFLPGFMNSLAGILSTIVNIYGAQHGVYNKASIATISVTGGVAVVCGLLTLWYGVWLLGRIKKQHVKEIGIDKAGKHGEGMWAGFKGRIGKQT